MLLSIVIPAFNEARLLPLCLASLPAADGVEVIVVDNNSTDATAAIAKQAGARVVFEAQNQIARARNAGAAVAQGHWLLFLDADCVMNPGLFEDLQAVIKADAVVGAGSVMHMPGLPWWARGMLGLWTGLSLSLGWAAGSLVLCRAEAFRAVGGFNEQLYAAEEIDLSQKLKAWGRQRGQRFSILRRHPIETSNRKLELYSGREIAGQFLRLVTRPWRGLRDKKNLGLWYDGRR